MSSATNIRQSSNTESELASWLPVGRQNQTWNGLTNFGAGTEKPGRLKGTESELGSFSFVSLSLKKAS